MRVFIAGEIANLVRARSNTFRTPFFSSSFLEGWILSPPTFHLLVAPDLFHFYLEEEEMASARRIRVIALEIDREIMFLED